MALKKKRFYFVKPNYNGDVILLGGGVLQQLGLTFPSPAVIPSSGQKTLLPQLGLEEAFFCSNRSLIVAGCVIFLEIGVEERLTLDFSAALSKKITPPLHYILQNTHPLNLTSGNGRNTCGSNVCVVCTQFLWFANVPMAQKG